MRKIGCSVFLLGTLLFHSKSYSEVRVPAQGRVFIGSTQIKPNNLNIELQAQGLKKMELNNKYGADVLFPIASFLDTGFRYTHHTVISDETTSSPSTPWEANIDQDSVMAIVRIPFVKTNILRLDAFAGFGGTNTKYKIKTATQDGQLTKKNDAGWLATPYSVYGASLALGYKKFYLVLEGGIENNEIKNLMRSGNINGNIDTLDLSGSYFTLGLLFDGITASKK